MTLSDEKLASLLEATGAFVAQLQAEDAAAQAQGLPNPDNTVAAMQDMFACLRELQVWRAKYPHDSVTFSFETRFGVIPLQ